MFSLSCILCVCLCVCRIFVLLHALSGILVVVCSDLTKLLHNTIVPGPKKWHVLFSRYRFFMNVHLNSPSDHPSSSCTLCLFASLLCRWRSRAGNKELWLVELFFATITSGHDLFIYFFWYRKWLTLVIVDKTCGDNPEEFESGVRSTGCF